MSKYTKEQLKEMALQFLNSSDDEKKELLVAMMQIFTGLNRGQVLTKIKELAQ